MEGGGSLLSRFVASLIVFIGAAGYGVLATCVKKGYAMGFHVGEITGSQMFTGAVILWLIALFKIRNAGPLTWRALLYLLGVGSFTGLTGVFYYSSLNVLPASVAIILLFQFTWVGVLMEWLFDGKKPTKTTLVSLLLVLTGTVLAANLFGEAVYQFSWYGLFMGLCSAFTYAAFIYCSGKVATHISPWLRSPLMITGATLSIFIIFPPTFFVSGALWDGLGELALIMAFFGAILPTVCFNIGVPYIGSGMATILGSVELPVAVLMAWAVLSEAVSPVQWLGIILILAAIILGEWRTLKIERDTKKRLSNI
jgi:drug/metabolite transporter (DMT)-like permease